MVSASGFAADTEMAVVECPTANRQPRHLRPEHGRLHRHRRHGRVRRLPLHRVAHPERRDRLRAQRRVLHRHPGLPSCGPDRGDADQVRPEHPAVATPRDRGAHQQDADGQRQGRRRDQGHGEVHEPRRRVRRGRPRPATDLPPRDLRVVQQRAPVVRRGHDGAVPVDDPTEQRPLRSGCGGRPARRVRRRHLLAPSGGRHPRRPSEAQAPRTAPRSRRPAGGSRDLDVAQSSTTCRWEAATAASHSVESKRAVRRRQRRLRPIPSRCRDDCCRTRSGRAGRT